MRHGNPILLLLLLESNIDRHDRQEGPTAYFSTERGIKSKLCLPGPLYRQTDVLLC